MSLRFQIVTYNLLSEKYGTPKGALSQDVLAIDPSPAWMTIEDRWLRVRAKLDTKVAPDVRAVICLQETSLEWTMRLVPFFAEHGYAIVYDNFSRPDSGYMGVALAVPLDKYTIVKHAMIKVGDELGRVTRTSTSSWSGASSYGQVLRGWNMTAHKVAASWLPRFLGKRLAPERTYFDEWTNAVSKPNTLLALQLVSKEKDKPTTFCVGTYHMPCRFVTPTMTASHGAMLMHQMDQFSGVVDKVPFVLAGDYNLRPHSEIYGRLVGGAGTSVRDLCDVAPWHRVAWSFDVPLSLQSAYPASGLLGGGAKEPLFTTRTQPSWQKTPFADTLDYLFFSAPLVPVAIERLPFDTHRHQIAAVGDDLAATLNAPMYPNALEPSDHLLIGATFELAH